MEDLSFALSVVETQRFCQHITVQVHQREALRGEMQFKRVSRKASADAGVDEWALLADTSCAQACGEEVEELLHIYRPETLLILESFTRVQGYSGAQTTLSAAVSELFEARSAWLAPQGALLMTYPFPLDVFDEEVAAKLASLYEKEWGMSTPIPGGQLRVKQLPALSEESKGYLHEPRRVSRVQSSPHFH